MKAQRSTRNKRPSAAKKKNQSPAPFQFSKLIVIFTSILFVVTLIVVLIMKLDLAVCATALTVTGSILLTSLVEYGRKASSENVKKIEISYYQEAMKTRLNYNRSMMELMKEYGMTKEDVDQIEYESPMDEVTENALCSGGDKLHQRSDDTQAMPQVHNAIM